MNWIEDSTVPQLLKMHSEIITELRRREIVRSANSPSGDYAELLFASAFDWTLQNKSASGYDATDKVGVRYQIKCRRITPQNPSRQLSFMRKLDTKPFDVLAAVLLKEDFTVVRAALIPAEIVLENAKYVAHVNAWRFILRDSVWSEPGVRDVTGELREAESGVGARPTSLLLSQLPISPTS
jgi:hypothetical protein